MASFRLDIDWLAKDIDGEIKPKYWKECHVLRYGPSKDLDEMQNVEDLVVKAFHDDDEAFKTIQYVLNNCTPKSLEIWWLEQEKTAFERQFITKERMQTLADSLSNNKTLKSFKFGTVKNSFFEDKQSMEILAKGIDGSNLEFAGFVSIPEFAMDTIYTTISTNRTLRKFYLKDLTGLGSHLDKFILSSNITKLHLIQIVLDDAGIDSIKNILINTKTLVTFELRQFEVRSLFKNFSDICIGIKENRTLKSLIMEPKLSDSKNLMALDIGPKLPDKDVMALMSALKCHPTIDTLKISVESKGYNKQFDIVVENLLSDESSLTSISINKPFGDHTPYDTELDLSTQNLINFANAIAANTTLRHLSLGNTNVPISPEYDCQSMFGNALKLNTTLLTLDLPVSIAYTNLITTNKLIEFLQHNTTLTKLIVNNIYVSSTSELTEFFNAIRQHKSLTSLDISELKYSQQGFQLYSLFDDLMQDLIVNSKTLRELKCRSNPDSLPYTIPMLLSSLKHNESLTSVEIFSVHATRALLDFNQVADVFSVNKTLLHINTHMKEKKMIEPYLRRNRRVLLDAIILVHNIFRSDQAIIFPNEIWIEIFGQLAVYSVAIYKVLSEDNQNKTS